MCLEGLQVARLAREDCVWHNVCMGLVKAEHVQIYQMLLEWETWLEPQAIYGPRDAGSEVIVSLIVGLECVLLEVAGLVGI